MTADRMDTEAVEVGRRMRVRAIAAIGVGMTVLLGACSTDREITRPEPVPVTDKLINEAVLTVEDLPDGWAESAETTPIATDVIVDHKCDDALNELEPEVEGGADFDLGGLHLSNQVAYFPGNGAQIDTMMRDIAEDCEQVVIAEKGISVRTLPLDFGVLSDDTLPLRFELEPTTGPITEHDLILIREGDLVSFVRLSGPRPSDKALLDTAVRASIGNLSLLADQT
jgi:hypothetical protein